MLNWWRKRTKNQKLEIFIDLATVAIGMICLFAYYHQDTVEIPLSQAVELSKGDVFSDLVFSSGTLMLIVAEDKIAYTEDVESKGVKLKGGQEVIGS